MRTFWGDSARIGAICVAGLCLSGAAYGAIGDVDGDRDVDLSDLAGLLAAYGACTGDPTFEPGADVDGNGCVNLTDLSLVLANFGQDDCDCPDDVFLDVASAPGPGPGYPAPSLSVSCQNGVMTVQSNGIPHYTFVPITPNDLAPRNLTWQVPICPDVAALPQPIPLLGGTAFTVNGQLIFGPNEGANPPRTAFGDPIFNDIMDPALGHTAGGGVYHYHGLVEKVLSPEGLVAEPWLLPDPDGSEPSNVIGFGFDGFPIYGKYCCADAVCSSVIEMQSSYVLIGDPTSQVWDAYEYQVQAGAQYLDACNGHYGPDGTYHYHATDTFPYIMGCYAGTP